MATKARWHEQCGTPDGAVVVHFDAAQPIVLNQDPLHGALDDLECAGRQLEALHLGEARGRREEHDVVGPLADDLGVAHRVRRSTQNAERLIEHLVAVAIQAVQNVARPPLAKTRDFGQSVAQPGRY